MKKRLIFILLILSLSSFYNVKKLPTSISSYISEENRIKAVLHIKSDSDFILLELNGTGTETNPYIIENLVIESNDRGGIYIKGTTKNCIIRNCTIFSKQYGIYIDTILDGSIVIENNFCSVSGKGISSWNSDGIIIQNNTCFNCTTGIDVSIATNLKISENNISTNKWVGIELTGVKSSIVKENYCFNNSGMSIYVFQSSLITIENNICINNSIEFLSDIYGTGLVLVASDFCTIENNHFSFNGFSGISISLCDFAIIYNNTIESNVAGIEINMEKFYTIETGIAIVFNCIKNNEQFGIFIGKDARKCLIYSNLFIGNNKEGILRYRTEILDKSQAFDENKKNDWYDEIRKTGNFWSELEDEQSYKIDGIGENEDLYPITSLDKMEKPSRPDFPKGIWFPEGGFYTIRITFVFLTPFLFLFAIILLRRFLRKSKSI